MSPKLTQLRAAMTPQEQTEVEAFAAFLLVRRQLQQLQLLPDDISVQELTELVGSCPLLVIHHYGIAWHPAGFYLIYLHTPA